MTRQPAAPVMTTLVEDLPPDVPSGPVVLREGLGGVIAGVTGSRIVARIAEIVGATVLRIGALAVGLVVRASGVPRC